MNIVATLGVAVGLAVAVPITAVSQEAQSVRLAQASPPVVLPPAESSVPPPPVLEPTFEDRVAVFVTAIYLSSDLKTNEDLELLYANRVAYFGKADWPLARVVADKSAYFARWPRRSYRLIRNTLRAERQEGEGRVYDVAFDYEFDVASARRVSRGRGRAALTIDLDNDGGRITRETGTVLARW